MNILNTNGMNQISMDRISFLVTLIHSYSDHKLNVSSDNSKVVGTIILFKSSPVRKFSGSRAVSRAPVPIYRGVRSSCRVRLSVPCAYDKWVEKKI